MIDIIICAYNAHKFLRNALESVVKQTLNSLIKVTIVNDGSDHDYQEIVDEYTGKLNINVINLKRNHGLGYAKQVGLAKTKNEYFMYLDSDDKLEDDNSVEKLYNEMQKDPSLKLVCGMINKNGEIMHSDIFIHGKLFKRSHTEKYRIKHKNLYIYEDLCFLNAYECLLDKNEKENISDVVYSYNQGISNDSITSTKKNIIKATKYLIYSYNYGFKLAKKYKKEYNARKKAVFFFKIMYGRVVLQKKHPFKSEEERLLYSKQCTNFYLKHKEDLERYITYNEKESWFDNFVNKLLNR